MTAEPTSAATRSHPPTLGAAQAAATDLLERSDAVRLCCWTTVADARRAWDAGLLRDVGTTMMPTVDASIAPHGPWRAIEARLSARASETLTGAELEELADALFWLDRPAESTATWHRAYAAHLAAADARGAAMAAWRAFYDHFLVGERAVAAGWLERARELLHRIDDDAPAGGYVAIAEADVAGTRGDLATALRFAEQAVGEGRRTGDRDLSALAMATQGRLLIAAERIDDGVALLDSAMVGVIAGELTAMFTGWVFCTVLEACHGLADLERAAEWTDAATQWCETLPEGRLYPGLCRVHHVELTCLRGAWEEAEAQARRACEELLAHDPRYAGEAVYIAGELRRLRGDHGGAEQAYQRAHELGRPPQPGLALLRLAQGDIRAGRDALRVALQQPPGPPLARARLLSAAVEAELLGGDRDTARRRATELDGLAATATSIYLQGLAAAADGAVALATGDLAGAVAALRGAYDRFTACGFAFDTARVQVHLGVAAGSAGDHEGARLELTAAHATFSRLGALSDARRVTVLLSGQHDRPGGLTGREIDVLRLVAAGLTNRRIAADLGISEHTVARHMSNIRTKLGVRSRAAATAFAVEHDLVSPGRS